MASIKKGYVDIADGQIHYRSSGGGRSVLLLHQAMMSSEEYDGVLPLLGARLQAIAMDLPGHGNSDDPPRECEIEDFASSVIAFLDAMNIARTSIVGHHTGALIATEVAVRHHERLDRLILSGCPVWEAEQYQRYLFRPTPMTADGGDIMLYWKTYRKMSARTDPQQWFKPFVIGLKARTRPYDAHWAAARYQIKTKLGLVKCPTLLLSGSEDFFYKQLESTRSMIPGAITGVIEGAAVFTAHEQPEAFAEAILKFLEPVSGA